MDFVAVIFFFVLFATSNAEISDKIGINYGQLGNNLPTPYRSIQLIQSLQAGRIKLYDANPEILKVLSGTKIQVSIMVPNNQINDIASNLSIANQWVDNNVLQYYPDTRIRFILVGNEVLSYYSDQDKEIWRNLVPAMRNIKTSLKSRLILNIKVATPLAMDILQNISSPSNATFRTDISDSVVVPLLKFLNGTKSFFFINAYPFFSYANNPTDINLGYALLNSSHNYTDPITGLVYYNLLDQMLDSVIFAMTKLGYDSIRLGISETGWPTAGDIDQPGANLLNAATYNRNLIKKLTANPPTGTPARPGVTIPTFIFSLYDENQKPGPETERHWGLLNENGKLVYEIDLSGKRTDSEYTEALPQPTNNRPYQGKLWCVSVENAEMASLESAIAYACDQVNGTCDALAPGKECYAPVSATSHASYAFSSYWAKFRSQGGNCYFNGLAHQTAVNPSHGSCEFPSVDV